VSELPPTWAEVPLSAVTVDASQRVPLADEVIRYIDIGSVNRNTKSIESPQELLGKDAPSRARKQVAVGDTLVSMTRPNLNAVALVPKELDGQIASTGFDVLRPVAGVDPRWIGYLVRTEAFVEAMSDLVQGALYPAVRSKDVRAHVVPLAPQAEQTRIANQLDTLLTRAQACNDRFDAIPALLKRFRQTVLTAASSGDLTSDWRESKPPTAGAAAKEVKHRLDTRRDRHVAKSKSKFKEPVLPDLTNWRLVVPESWSVESVSAFAECLDHVRVPVTKDKRATAERLYPYFGANGQVDMVDDFLFDDELVMVTEDETFYGRVKPIAYRFSGRCWVNNHAHVLLAGDRVRADFLCFSLMHYDVQPWLTGTTGRAKLTQGALNALPLAVPPHDEMIEIVRRVNSMFALADRIEARCTAARSQAQRLTPLVLAKAFRGELVPQDPNDEPASALLVRIDLAKDAVAAKPRKRKSIARNQAVQ
jgi:type I restriction enzyme S subunit